MLAHNLDYIDIGDPNQALWLVSGDEIAVFPPVSGG